MAIYPIGYIQGFFLLRPVFESLSEYKIASGFPVTGLISGLISYVYLSGYIRKIKKILVPNFLPLYILIFVGSLSFINSPSLSISIAHLIRLISWISLGVIVYNAISHRKDVVKVLAAISYSSIVPMIFGYYQYFLKRGTIDPVTGPYVRLVCLPLILGVYFYASPYLPPYFYTSNQRRWGCVKYQ
jgi:hypothetical protein